MAQTHYLRLLAADPIVVAIEVGSVSGISPVNGRRASVAGRVAIPMRWADRRCAPGQKLKRRFDLRGRPQVSCTVGMRYAGASGLRRSSRVPHRTPDRPPGHSGIRYPNGPTRKKR